IHIRPDGWSWALLDGSARKWSIREHGEGGLDPSSDGPSAGLTAGLTRGLKGVGKVDNVVVALPSTDTVLREISLPFHDRDKIHQVLKFEVESELYHLNVDDVLCDYIELVDERATASLMVAALPKAQLETSLEILDECGQDPELCELDFGALTTAVLECAPEVEEEEVQATLSLGSLSSVLMVHDAEGIRAVRVINLGWRELARGLDDDEDATPIGGEELDLEAGEESIEDVDEETPAPTALFGADASLPLHLDFETVLAEVSPETLSQFLRSLTAEVRRGLAAVGGTPIGSLNLLGPSIPGLPEALAGRIGIPCEPIQLAGESNLEMDAVAFGAALRGLGLGGSAMDFRQDEFRQSSGLEKVEGALTLMLVGLIAWFLVDGVVLLQKTKTRMQDTDALFERSVQYVERMNEGLNEDAPNEWRVRTSFDGLEVEPLSRIDMLKGRVSKAKLALDELVGAAGVSLPQSCLNAWRLVSEVLSSDLGEQGPRWMVESLEFTSMDARANREPQHVAVSMEITIFDEGEGDDLRTFERLQAALNRQPWMVENAEAPDGFKNQNETVPNARTGLIELKVNTGWNRGEES
ncbi:MAG: hypothetical protein MK213_02640, partial [Planctomycetes bacterium]|nr:hypothetical protein [Planctomycetota bacterium]